tara:strand:- start:5245 stop:6027 length:783 start_codon:yes stop_codon:yes gene_type:complete
MKFAKRSLGQNFLIDQNIIKKIISLVKIKNQNVIEIGPGSGALTEEIFKREPKTFTVIEKDNHLAKELNKKYYKKEIKIYNEDILRFDLQKLNMKNSIIFGNLPYNISSQIFVKFIRLNKLHLQINNLIFMFQKELGEKIISNYPSKKYGRLSILSNLKFNISSNFLVSPNCFYPKPKINSMIIHFVPKKKINYNIKEIGNLEKITNIFFSNKRKMINKSLKKIFKNNEFEKIKELKTQLRPENVKPEIYYKITELFEKS